MYAILHHLKFINNFSDYLQMSIEKYLDKMKNLQSEFLEFIEDDEIVDENKIRNLCLILENTKIRDNKNDLKLFLYHISSVCKNHHRDQNFFGKIERLLQILKADIQKYYTNSEVFNIFKKDKRILLFLIEEKIIIFDEYVVKALIQKKYTLKNYPQYFAPEIKAYIDKNWFPKYDPRSWCGENKWVEEIKKELPDNFYEIRKFGENDSNISKLIREDNVEEFIAYVNRSNLSPNARIQSSIYETNSFLMKKYNESNRQTGISIIEYAAFFGSIQIIKYLEMQGVELPPDLWLYVIHSQNAELIHFLEDLHVGTTQNNKKGDEKPYDRCFKESIKCNHNDMANYFLNNFMQNGNQLPNDIIFQILKSYNFLFMQIEHLNKSLFCRLCKYDYYLFVKDLLTESDINCKIIQNHLFK